MNQSTSILRKSPICLGATKNFTVLLSSASGVFLIRSTNALDDFSYVEITSSIVPGAFAIFPNSMPPSRACSLAFCSVTNIQASSLADLHLPCGFMSALALGYALSTLIVVGSSRSSAPRNCSFSVIGHLLIQVCHYASFTTSVSFSKHLVHPISWRWRWSSVGNSSCVRTNSVALPRPRNSTVTSVSPASGSSSQRQVYTSFRGGSTSR